MNTQPKIFKWSLIIGIVIVLNLFFNYTLSLVYQEPLYEAFCPNTAQVIEPITEQNECIAKGGQWNGNVYNEISPLEKPISKGYCDTDFSCRNDFESARNTYDRNVFITLVLLGAICVAIGNFLKSNVLIGIAVSLAGVLSFIVASMRYWGSADNLIKVVILALALAILVWVAMKKFKDN